MARRNERHVPPPRRATSSGRRPPSSLPRDARGRRGRTDSYPASTQRTTLQRDDRGASRGSTSWARSAIAPTPRVRECPCTPGGTCGRASDPGRHRHRRDHVRDPWRRGVRDEPDGRSRAGAAGSALRAWSDAGSWPGTVDADRAPGAGQCRSPDRVGRRRSGSWHDAGDPVAELRSCEPAHRADGDPGARVGGRLSGICGAATWCALAHERRDRRTGHGPRVCPVVGSRSEQPEPRSSSSRR